MECQLLLLLLRKSEFKVTDKTAKLLQGNCKNQRQKNVR